MASTPKQVNGSGTNGPLGKRKKTRASKGSYLSKWLDKTMHHIQESTPSMETYDSFLNPNLNWQMGNAQFASNFDPCRFNMYGYAPEPMSLPALPTYYSPMVPQYCTPEYRCVQSANKSIQVQRPRQRRRSDNRPEEITTPGCTPNSTLSKNFIQAKNYTDSQDFASLPPIVTSVGDTTSNSDMNTNEKDSNTRRFSDPCVQGLPDVACPVNGDADSASESSDTSGSQVGNRLLACLLDQITTLKMANERLNKDLQETKAELVTMRQQNAIWQKGSSSSLGGTPNHNPLTNGMLGANYSPGFLTDLVREIRDAARMREEALYSRVRAMVHDRTDNGLSPPDSKFTERGLEEIKNSLRASESDKCRMMDRINKLEEELNVVKVASGLDNNEKEKVADKTNGNIEETEAERLKLMKELADAKKAKHSAEEHAFKLERIVTQLRSKFNGLQLSPNGPESIPSEAEADANGRVRRTSVNSSSNSTVVFGPVTDL